MFESKFLVEGMTCSSCVATVETAVKNIEQKNILETVRVDLLSDSMTVKYNAVSDDRAREMTNILIDTVEVVGFDCKHVDTRSYSSKKNKRPRQPLKMMFDFSATDFGKESSVDTVARVKDTVSKIEG